GPPASPLFVHCRAGTRHLHSFPTRRSSDLCTITPSANTSVRRSTFAATHCSGDMYANLPLIVPAFVLVSRSSARAMPKSTTFTRSEEHTSELQSRENLVCRLLLEKKNE